MPDQPVVAPVVAPIVGGGQIGEGITDILFSQGVLSKKQYDDIKLKSATGSRSPDDILQELHIVDEEKIAEARATLLGVPYINLSTASFSPEALSFVPRAVVERFQLIPFLYDDKTKVLSIAMSNPADLDALSFLQQKTGLIIKTFGAAPQDVKNAISAQYRQELVGEVGKAVKETEELQETNHT